MLLTGLPDLVAQAYEAACDPPRMGQFVAGASEYFAAQRVGLLIWPHARPEFLLPITAGLEPGAADDLFAARADPRSLFGRLLALEPGESFAASRAAAAGEGWPEGHVLAGLVESDSRNGCALLLIRDDGHDGFSAADQEALHGLMRYLRRAIAVNAGHIRLYARHRAASLLLDGAPRGVAFLGEHGQLVYCNAEAGRMLAAGDGLAGQAQALRFADGATQAALERFLAATRAGEQPQPLALRIDRPSSRPAYQVVVYRLGFTPSQAALDPDQALAAALLHDPDAPQPLTDELLRTFFHLTPAEAHVTQALYRGASVAAAAQALGISVNTARTHLRSIFTKVGVNTQAALIQQISHSLRIVGRDRTAAG